MRVTGLVAELRCAFCIYGEMHAIDSACATDLLGKYITYGLHYVVQNTYNMMCTEMLVVYLILPPEEGAYLKGTCARYAKRVEECVQ